MVNYGRFTSFRTDVLDARFYPLVPNSNAFVEYRPRADQTVTLTFTDISNAGAFRDLLTFVPNRTARVPSELDHRYRNSHVRIAVAFKQSFGGGGAKAKPAS